ncbi:MAG: DUF2793 domain-containing protein [Candidatus Sphingomonas colombiensis]|nr:DUF2793 domain-containing protein [Sphingomonas sp.]WEK44196.1 MAG: DUF2793 domain-containing protein [Sphingomonas sp.]
MSDDRSPRFALPLLQPGQAQKETDHNEALALLEIATQAGVKSVAVNVPPPDPVPGECWILGTAPTGDWTGHAGAIAGWTAGGWRFVAPLPGMVVWSIADGVPVRYLASGWRLGEIHATRLMVDGVQIVGARRGAIADPAGGANVDNEARDTLRGVLAALREHGLIA